MPILSYLSTGLEFWSVNHILIYENSESQVLKILGQISNNWPNDLLAANVCKTCESCWYLLLTILQCINTTMY